MNISTIFLVMLTIVLVYCCTLVNFEQFMDTEPSLKQTTYRHILSETKEALDALDIPFFLRSGTCLGYVRERDFIEHDYDIDIGIKDTDFKPQLISEMTKRGLYLYRVLGTLKSGMELSFYLTATPLNHRAKIDIFVHKEKGPKTCWYTYTLDKTKKLKYCVTKFDLEEVDFLGIKVNIPNPVKKYLTEHYGKDWRIPKSSGVLGDYSFSSSPISLVNDFETVDDDMWY